MVSIQQSLQNRPVGRGETILQNFLKDLVEQFLVQNFCGCLQDFLGKTPVVHVVLLYHEQETHLTSSLDENSIELDFQMDRKQYVDLRQTFLAWELKLIEGRDYITPNPTESRQKHKMIQNRMRKIMKPMKKWRKMLQFLWSLM